MIQLGEEREGPEMRAERPPYTGTQLPRLADCRRTVRTVRRCVRTYVCTKERTRRPPRIKLNELHHVRELRKRADGYPGIGREKERERERPDPEDLTRCGASRRGRGRERTRQGEVSRQPRGYIAFPGCPRGLTFSSAREFLHAVTDVHPRTTPRLLTACFFYRNLVFASCRLSGYERVRKMCFSLD